MGIKIKKDEVEFDDKGRVIINNKEFIADLKKQLDEGDADVSGQGWGTDSGCRCTATCGVRG